MTSNYACIKWLSKMLRQSVTYMSSALDVFVLQQ